ncbi:YraN family protein [Vibrio sp. HA2012]|uniref:penicillin-binding protein activator n=1 Tax=Vibrio sp. HA2012 TaxID=1971595 RepID=UPI000C2B8469|nr:penicillin-binding protein activator [Vibrio sp. HA2012]PJC84931.1 YraN family protein [Vibrio sp. HA2012]
MARIRIKHKRTHYPQFGREGQTASKTGSISRLLTPIALAITLAACSSKPPEPEQVDITSEPTLSAQAYLMKADTMQGSLQSDWLIMALKADLKQNNSRQAALLIKRLAQQNLSDTQQAEWQLARAELLFAEGQTKEALTQLHFQHWWKLPDQQWQDFHTLRIEMLSQLNDYVNVSREWLQLASFLSDEEQEQVAVQVWQNLSHYSQYEISSLSAEEQEPELSRWLQLAVYMKTMSGNVLQLKNTLEKWLQENPQHLAARYIPAEIRDILDLEIVQPSSTALLLPLTGKYAKQAELVRSGFLLSMLDDSDREEDAILTVIDTHARTMDDIYQELKEKGIDFIVGPLIKDNIERLQTLQGENEQRIPMLALNFPEQPDAGSDFCYLTLSPEQEIAQGARHLFSEGFQYPLIFVPQGSYGERIATAFQSEWKKYSRTPAAVSYFGSREQLQQNVNSVFGLQDSQARIAQMENLLGTELESQARSRRDIDSVYIAASSADLTLIKPFIEVAVNPDAKPPKLFANSRSNSGGKRQFEDLSGVIFSDIPMLTGSDSGLNHHLDELWPNQSNDEKRLMALGMDAYQLINELPQMKVAPDYRVQGKTGILSLDDQCVIQREINWAEFDAL